MTVKCGVVAHVAPEVLTCVVRRRTERTHARTLNSCVVCVVFIELSRAPVKTGRGTQAAFDDACARSVPCGACVCVVERRFRASRSSLVDPASSYMLVSKIKPCMSQCKPY